MTQDKPQKLRKSAKELNPEEAKELLRSKIISESSRDIQLQILTLWVLLRIFSYISKALFQERELSDCI